MNSCVSRTLCDDDVMTSVVEDWTFLGKKISERDVVERLPPTPSLSFPRFLSFFYP